MDNPITFLFREWRENVKAARARKEAVRAAWRYAGVVGSSFGNSSVYLNDLSKEAYIIGCECGKRMIDYQAMEQNGKTVLL